MTKDMTQGEPGKVLAAFSVPLLISVVFQQLYSIVDSVVAGKFAGVDALAAVGASYPVTMIYMAIATGVNIGSSVIISQYFGAKDYKSVKCAIYTSLKATAVLSLLITLAGSLACGLFIRLLGTPANVFGDSALYLRIYTWGIFFLFMYNICTGVFTALGDSRTPLYFLIASSLGNIVLDIAFVAGLKMGVAGVAWATFLCQGIAALFAFVALTVRVTRIGSGEGFERFSWQMLSRICRVAVPSILQQSFISVGNLFIQRRVNSYGSDVMAAYSAAIKLNTFVITSITTLANGLSSFTAQNIGAGQTERVKQGFRAGVKLVLSVCAPVVAIYLLFGGQLMGIFLSDTEDVGAVLREGILFLNIVSPFYLVVSLKLTADGVLRGAGAMGSFMIATFSDLILRVILAYVLSLGLGLGSMGIWLSWPIGWVIGTLCSLYFYKRGAWMHTNML